MIPLQLWVASLINRCVALGWGWTDIEFSWHEEEQTNPAEQATVATTYLKAGVLTINQVLADIGRDPIEGGDVNLIYTATGAVPLSVVLAPPPPPPVPSQIGHNGGPPLKPDGAVVAEDLLKAAPAEARLTQIWTHFLTHSVSRVAEIVSAALPEVLEKAASIEPPENPDPAAASDDTAFQDAVAAARLAASVSTSIETAIEAAVRSMPWPAVQASTEAVLQTQALAAVKSGVDVLGQVAGIDVTGKRLAGGSGSMPAPDALAQIAGTDAAGTSVGSAGAINVFRRANPAAVAWAQAHAAELITGVTETTRAALTRLVTQAQAEGWTMKQLSERIVSDYAFSPERADLIARTEVKRSSAAGSIEGWKALSARAGITTLKRTILGTNENHCVVCRSAVLEGAIALDDSWSAGFAPPFHPACYCNLVPVTGTELEKAFNGDQPRGPAGKWAPGAPYDAAAEIQRGKAAISRLMTHHGTEVAAMNVRDIGPVSFVWGVPGRGKDFKGGWGISHIVDKRNAEGHDGAAFAHTVPEILAKGTMSPERGRWKITLGNTEAIVTHSGSGGHEPWVLTAYHVRA